MDLDLEVKIAIYRYFAETGGRPSVEEIGHRVGASVPEVTEAYRYLRDSRVAKLLVHAEIGRCCNQAFSHPTRD